MQLRLYHKYVNNQEVLYYYPTALERMQAMMLGEEVQTGIYLRKVSEKPSAILPQMMDCLREKQKAPDVIIIPPKKTIDTVAKKPNHPKPVDIIVKTKPNPKNTDSTTKILLPPVNQKDSLSNSNPTGKRINIEQAHLEINTKKINLKVYDNAIIDGDTVSIYYNNKLLLSHQPLSEKAIDIDIMLDDNQQQHKIVLFAENLGSIPPNTALVVVTAGQKRFELFASATLQENAVLLFVYKAK